MSHQIISSRFDTRLPDASTINLKKIRCNFSYSAKKKHFNCISSDGYQVYDGEKKTPLKQFITENRNNYGTFLVLTDFEAEKLRRWQIIFKFTVVSFESAFPVFSGIKFQKNLVVTYRSLTDKIALLRRYGIVEQTLSADCSNRLSKILQRKIKTKTSYDECFAHAYPKPYQEVFRFEESRPDRRVLALDFNSMYPFCMSGSFPDPSKIQFVAFDKYYTDEDLSSGLYKVKLSEPHNENFNKFHPFYYTQKGNTYPFLLKSNNSIDIQLFDFEIDYYKNFFHKVFIYSGLISDLTVGHPLYKESRRLFRLRLQAIKNKTHTLEKLYKYQLAMLHSATNKKVIKKRSFKSLDKFSLFMANHFLFQNSTIRSPLDYKKLRNQIQVNNVGGIIQVRYQAFDSPSNIYSFSSQIVAKARLIMTQTILSLLQFDELDICYSNADSIHISIPKERIQNFLESYSHLIGSDMGQMKIQAIADSGIWFDVGRYYLYTGESIQMFKNAGLNHKGNIDPFLTYREHHRSLILGQNKFIVKEKSTLRKLNSNKKHLRISENNNSKVINFERFYVEDIADGHQATLCEQEEELSSGEFKYRFYQKMKKSLRWDYITP